MPVFRPDLCERAVQVPGSDVVMPVRPEHSGDASLRPREKHHRRSVGSQVPQLGPDEHIRSVFVCSVVQPTEGQWSCQDVEDSLGGVSKGENAANTTTVVFFSFCILSIITSPLAPVRVSREGCVLCSHKRVRACRIKALRRDK